MYSSGAKRRRIKPYARPTSFDYNVRFDIRHYQDVKYNRIKDPYFHAASNDECFRVMEGELVAKSNTEGSRYNDKELHVFSFANGLSAPATAARGLANQEFAETTSNSLGKQRALRREILKTLQYMGVAVTEFSPSRDVYEQGFVCTIAGLNTLYNNGSNVIYPGQTICMDLPELRQTGRGNQYKRALQQGLPREKLQFIVRPRGDMVADYGDAELVNRFIIGTAISYSRPGDTVDVILHRMNYTSASVQPTLKSSSSGPSLVGLSKLFPDAMKDKVQAGLGDIVDSLEQTGDDSLLEEYMKASGKSDLDDVVDKIREEEESLRVKYALEKSKAVGPLAGINAAKVEAALDRLRASGYNDANTDEEAVVVTGVSTALKAEVAAAANKTDKLSGISKQLMAAVKAGTAVAVLANLADGMEKALAVAGAGSVLGDHPLSWSDNNTVSNIDAVLDATVASRQVPHLHGASSTSTPSISAAVGVKKKKGKK